MLLEYAVSYRFWKERLKVRLLMQKVVTRELAEQIVITAEDISKYYQEHLHESRLSVDAQNASENVNKLIIRRLRREKAELAYRDWLKTLRRKYPVEINQDKWQAIYG
jgi:hypothetical protein